MSADAAIQDLCAAIGVAPRELPLVLRFERSGDLHIERRGDAIVVYLARHVPLYRHGVAAAALQAVHPDRRLPYVVKAAFHGDETLILLARMREQDVDLPALGAITRLLTRLADEAETAGAA